MVLGAAEDVKVLLLIIIRIVAELLKLVVMVLILYVYQIIAQLNKQ